MPGSGAGPTEDVADDAAVTLGEDAAGGVAGLEGCQDVAALGAEQMSIA
jgi:hypothetical protein